MKNKRNTKPTVASQPQKFRLIGGKWRGRKFPIAHQEGLRPTSDRHRETLFNWLQNDVQGISCWDLFAGTGALGLEALSRGADRCIFFEKGAPAAEALHNVQAALQISGEAMTVVQTELPTGLTTYKESPELVLMDAPFSSALTQACLETIFDHFDCSETIFYIETSASSPSIEAYLSSHTCSRSIETKTVRAQLFRPK